MKPTLVKLRYFAWPAAVLFVLFLVPAIFTSRSGAQGTAPADLTALLSKAQQALKSGNTEALKPLGENVSTFEWLSHRARAADTKWQAYLLPVPGGAEKSMPVDSPYLLVFSAYHSCQSIADHFHKVIKTSQGWRVGAELPETNTLGYRVRDHKFTIRFDLPSSSAFLTDDVMVERTSAAAGDPCLLRLSSNMLIDSVKYKGQSFKAEYCPGVIAFTPPNEKIFTLSLVYHGAFTQPGMDSYVKETEAYLNSYWYPHIARLPAKYGCSVTVLKGWTADGQGEPTGREEKRHTTVFSFRNEIPVSYFSVDAGPYIITSRMVNGRKISTYQLRENPAGANRALDEVTRSMAVLEKSYGPFPYNHYELIQTLGPFGGALEAYSFATFAGRDYGAVTHELSHTWWGGILPNPYTKTLWNESFAVYSDGYVQRQIAVTKPAHAARGLHAAPSFGRNLTTAYGVPISKAFDTENPVEGSVGYGKGATVLAMLEDLLGTDTMLRCMRRFRDDHVSGEAADWPEFEKAVNKTTGKDYRWFFEQWTERPGVPIVSLANVKRLPGDGNTLIRGEIVQEGKPYRLAIPVVVEAANGKTVTKIVETTGAVTTFEMRSVFPPATLRLDPEGTVLMAGGKGEEPFSFKF
jgi:aminopeptidase N